MTIDDEYPEFKIRREELKKSQENFERFKRIEDLLTAILQELKALNGRLEKK